jgi:hypothetical protein
MDMKHEVTLLRREEEVLASAPGAGEAPPLERRERRVERLQCGDVRRAGRLDRSRAHGIVQTQPVRLDLGKLGNSSSSWTRSA